MTRTITDAELAQLRKKLETIRKFAEPAAAATAYDALTLLNTIAARTSEPVAWMHDAPGRRDVIHSDVKQLLERVDTDYLHRKIYKAEHYTIPLYTHPQPPVPDGWQPIETAPKDGTPILLCKKSRCGDGFFTQGSYEGKGSWVWPYIKIDPTHWMPLPAAPKEATK